jgi:peptidyl-prolyl cis-trans isomerase SurA
MRNITLIAISFLFSIGLSAQADPTIMTVDTKKITQSEFLQIYLKNNPNPKYDKASLDEYMELFTKFKLKVAEAEALGYDTIPKLVKELNGYKSQLALPYLVDSAKNESLIKEAYDRTKNEIKASHILIKLNPNPSPEDTLAAFINIMQLKKRIENGEDFATVAMGQKGSEDPSVASNGGNLGYFTAFQMVYPFEDAAFKTPIGKLSNPFRTRFGYHIVKVMDKRASRGTITTAHIMVSVPKTAADDIVEAGETKINEIYELLKNGGNFEELVEKYSDDPSTNKAKGVLPAFGTGATTRMVSEFEEAAFDLKNDGDYSNIVRTDYGYHIIKRISLTPVASFDEMKSTIEAKVTKDERSKSTQDSFVTKLKKEYKYADKTKKTLSWFVDHIDSNYYKGGMDISSLKTNNALFILDGKEFKQQDFAKYMVAQGRRSQKEAPKTVVDKQYKIWEKQTILDYEESKLVNKYPAYKSLTTEYHDGILLYEIMSDKIWNKAMKDTTGLKEFYEVNKANYQWEKRISGVIYECNSAKVADDVFKLAKIDTMRPSKITRQINQESELNVRDKDGKFEIEKVSYLNGRTFTAGLNQPYEVDGKFYVIKVDENLNAMQKEFSEAKGSITSDYQTYLEKEWLKELRVKHPITINSEALYSVGK